MTSLLTQAAPGEFTDCVNDLRQILGSSLDESLIAQSTEAYYTKECETVAVDGKQILLTPHSRIAPGRLISPSHQLLFSYDFSSSEASAVNALDTLDEATEATRAGLLTAVAKYAADHYSNGLSEVFSVDKEGTAVLERDEEEEAVAGGGSASPVAADEAPSTDETSTDPTDATIADATTADATNADATTIDEASAGEPSPTDSSPAIEPTPTAEAEPLDVDSLSENEEAHQNKGVEGETTLQEEKSTPQEEESAPLEEESTPQEKEDSPQLQTEADALQETAKTPLVPVISDTFAIYVVGYKYSPRSFWTSRWVSSFKLDTSTKQLTGQTALRIHYFESGNVQLNTTISHDVTLPSANPADVTAAIKAADDKTHATIDHSYSTLSNDTFKSLRRALPKTRQKMDWNQIRSVNITSTKLNASF